MLEISNCYKLLHLDEDCSDLELRQRFRKCALASHPDRLKSVQAEAPSQISPFLKINEAYRRIVSYRKRMNLKKEALAHQMEQGRMSANLPSWQEIRCKLKDLNREMLYPTNGYESNSAFGKEMNRVYEEHMSVLQGLSKRLEQMKNH